VNIWLDGLVTGWMLFLDGYVIRWKEIVFRRWLNICVIAWMGDMVYG